MVREREIYWTCLFFLGPVTACRSEAHHPFSTIMSLPLHCVVGLDGDGMLRISSLGNLVLSPSMPAGLMWITIVTRRRAVHGVKFEWATGMQAAALSAAKIGRTAAVFLKGSPCAWTAADDASGGTVGELETPKREPA